MSTAMRGWAYLAVTVVLEVVATLALRASEGFTLLAPAVLAVVAYAGTVVVLSRALQSIAMSLAYVVWTAAGTAGIVLFSIILFDDTMPPSAWVGIGLVVLGVVLINAFPASPQPEVAAAHGPSEAHPERP